MKIIEFVKNIFFFLKRKISIYGIIALVLIILGIIFFGNKKVVEQTQIIKTRDFVQQVSVSGKVVASQDVNLSFRNSGRIEHIYTFVGKEVPAGALLATLDATDAEKNLHDAEIALSSAKLALEKIKLQNSNENMNADLQKAYDDGFTAVSDAFLDLPNIIPGMDTLLSSENISYNNIRISGKTAIAYRDSADLLYYKAKDSFEETRKNFRILDRNSSKVEIEKIIKETYDTVKLTADALKSIKNLVDYLAEDTGRASDFIDSQNTLGDYIDTINRHLSGLLSIETTIRNNKEAFSTTDLDLQSSLLSVKQRENGLQDAKNKLEDYYIRAPFSGVVTKVDAKVGETASFDIPLITMMSADTFQIESYIPEVNISKIKIGDKAKITLDAYGTDVFFDASVISIDPADTLKDGVSTYRVKLQFANKDERIKSGMTANVSITVFDKPNTIVIPGGIIFEKNGKKFVQVKENGKNVDREITLGATSALGQSEILSGLRDGDVVILNAILK